MIYLHKDAMEANSREVKWQFKINGELGTRTSNDRLVKHKIRLEVGRSFVKYQKSEVI